MYSHLILHVIGSLFVLAILTLLIALPIVTPRIYYSRDRLKLNHSGQTIVFILITAATGGPLFAYAYANGHREPSTPFVLGIIVMTFAALIVSDLLRLDYLAARADSTPFRIRLKTVFGIVAVAAFVIATLAPALREW